MTRVTTEYFHNTGESVQKYYTGSRLKQSNPNAGEEGRARKRLQMWGGLLLLNSFVECAWVSRNEAENYAGKM